MTDPISVWLWNATLRAHDGAERMGQALWNTAEERWPQLVQPLLGTDLDPYHHDDRRQAFVAEVTRLVEEVNGGRTD